MICWFYHRLLVVVFSSVILVSGQSIKMAKVCLTPGVNSKVNYTCESHQMVHVISKLYQEASDACDVIDDACQVQEDDQTNGFTTDCNGKTLCSEELSTFRINKTCGNIKKSLATVLYECVNDQSTDVCTITAASSGVDNILHLKFPNFLAISSGIDTCECDVTGTDISVLILEMRFAFDVRMQNNIPVLSAKANLTLTDDTDSWVSYPSFLMYNTEVINRTSNLSVMFDAKGSAGHFLWIRINGTSTLNIVCNGASLTTSANLTPVLSESRSTTTVTLNSSTTRTTLLSNNVNTTVIGGLCGVIALLLLVVAAFVTYFKFVKPRRHSAATLAAEVTEPHYELNGDNQGIVSQPSQNKIPNIPDSSPSHYSVMKHYSNMDNVYTGLEPQGDYPEELPHNDDSYTHLQAYAHNDMTHGYSGLRSDQVDA